MQWMREHSPQEIRNRMPSQYRAPDGAADLESLRTTIPMLSQDATISAAGSKAVKVRTLVREVRKCGFRPFANIHEQVR